MYRIDSGALTFLNRALGLSGNPDAETILEDGHVDQVIEIGQIARRSLPAGGGLWYAKIAITHTGVGDLLVNISNLYEPAHATPGTLSMQGFPGRVRAGFDMWVISASADTDDATDFNTLALSITTPANNQGISILNTAGVVSSPAATANEIPVVFWDVILTAAAGALWCGNSLSNKVSFPINRRIRRGSGLRLRSNADTAGTVTNTCRLLLGLFPEALGQDASF